MLEINLGSEYSPESAFVHYESLNDRQMALRGESFPEHLLIVRDRCYWSCICSITRGLINVCPIYFREAGNIPLTIDENSDIDYDNQSGLIIRFTRKLPMT